MNNAQNDYINSVNLNAGSDFPYLVLNVVNDQSYPRNPGFQVMHWHEDLQFIYVLDGEIELKTLDASVRADQGSGIFINKNVIHHVKETFPCRYNSFIFPDYFLKFYFGSPAAAFVEHIVGTWIGANRFYLCFPALQTLKTERLRFMPMRCFACSPRFGSKCAETFGCQAKTQIPLWALGCRNFYST